MLIRIRYHNRISNGLGALLVFLGGVVVILASGCASKQSGRSSGSEDSRPAYINIARSEWYSTTACQVVDCYLKEIDGIKFNGDRGLAPGKHVIKIRARWSNGYYEEFDLDIDALAAASYEIIALEMRYGEEDKATMKRLSVFPEGIAHIFMMAPAKFVEYLLDPFYIRTALTELFPPLSRPPGRQCFLWVEDVETRQLIDGTRPHCLAGDTDAAEDRSSDR
jgi:hypothetical protein